MAVALTHPSNQGHRVRALARCAYHFTMTRLFRRATITPIGSSMRIRVHPDRPASARPVYANPPDAEETAVWRRVVQRGDTIIDVGANVGIYTLLFADMGARVVSVEPGDTSELRHNLALNGLSIEVLEAAASNEAGTANFTASRDQQNSMATDHGAGGDVIEVKTVRLDDIIGRRTILGVKIDVEGFERLVLEGLSGALREHRVDVLQLEWNRQCEIALGEDRGPVADILHRNGYVLAYPEGDGHLRQCDGRYQEDESVDLFALAPAVAAELLGS